MVPKARPITAKQAEKPEERDPDQAWYWTEKWQRMEREAEEDTGEEQAKVFETMEDLLADLDSDDDD